MNYDDAKRAALQEFHKTFLGSALEKANGDAAAAAVICGMSLQSFYRLTALTFGSVKSLRKQVAHE